MAASSRRVSLPPVKEEGGEKPAEGGDTAPGSCPAGGADLNEPSPKTEPAGEVKTEDEKPDEPMPQQQPSPTTEPTTPTPKDERPTPEGKAKSFWPGAQAQREAATLADMFKKSSTWPVVTTFTFSDPNAEGAKKRPGDDQSLEDYAKKPPAQGGSSSGADPPGEGRNIDTPLDELVKRLPKRDVNEARRRARPGSPQSGTRPSGQGR